MKVVLRRTTPLKADYSSGYRVCYSALVQRVPELLHSIKRSIDRDRRPGRFLLIGSANMLLMSRISESLAGRASYLTLRPMTRNEQSGSGKCGIWEELIHAGDDEWLELISSNPRYREDWKSPARRGGFPTPSVHLETDDDRRIWFDGYVRTYLERDLQDLSSIAALPDFRRLSGAVLLENYDRRGGGLRG